MSHDEKTCINCTDTPGARSSDAISAGDIVQVNCPESPEHKEERQGWMGRVVRRNKNACTVEFFADFEERIYEAHHLVKVAERESRTETPQVAGCGDPKCAGKDCGSLVCGLPLRPGAVGVAVPDWDALTRKARDKAGWWAWDLATEILDAAAGDMPQPWRNATIALLAEHHPAVVIGYALATFRLVAHSIRDDATNHRNMMQDAIKTLEKLPHVPTMLAGIDHDAAVAEVEQGWAKEIAEAVIDGVNARTIAHLIAASYVDGLRTGREQRRPTATDMGTREGALMVAYDIALNGGSVVVDGVLLSPEPGRENDRTRWDDYAEGRLDEMEERSDEIAALRKVADAAKAEREARKAWGRMRTVQGSRNLGRTGVALQRAIDALDALETDCASPPPAETARPDPRFKVGDRVRSLDGAGTGTVTEVWWRPGSETWMVAMDRDDGPKDSWISHGAAEAKFEHGPSKIEVLTYGPEGAPAHSSPVAPGDEHAHDVVRARSLAIKLGRGPEVEDLVLAIIDDVRTEEREACAKTLEDFLERHKSAEGLKLWPVRECLDRIRKGGA